MLPVVAADWEGAEVSGRDEDGEQPARWVAVKTTVPVSNDLRSTAGRLGRAVLCCDVVTGDGSQQGGPVSEGGTPIPGVWLREAT
ncbi:hypothetical protein GCM10010342_75290 [Streptomyces anulatus]|nr:hypothetical protein GCM10010342_75290 [Streptomyces anulatus]